MSMEKDIFWEVFRRTGDPLCWLLSRRHSGEARSNRQTGDGEGKTPPPLS